MPQIAKKPPPPTIASVSQRIAKPPHMMLNGTKKMSAFVKRLVGSGAPTRSMCSSGESCRRTASESTEAATALAAVALPVLEPLSQVAEEAARVRAVDEAVVVRERDVHHR